MDAACPSGSCNSLTRAACNIINTRERPPTCALNPPAVPVLMMRSGLNAWAAMYVDSAAGTVPTLSTPCVAQRPFHTTCTSTALALPEYVTQGDGCMILRVRMCEYVRACASTYVCVHACANECACVCLLVCMCAW